MLILVGASASGKTEIAKQLVLTYGYTKCITTTTRKKRENEIDGISYHFISKEEFEKGLANNQFVESTSYQDNLYGLQKNDLKDNGVVVLETKGVKSLYNSDLNPFVCYIETRKSIRYKRMIMRGDKKEDIKKRIKTDCQIFDLKELKPYVSLVIKNECKLSKTVNKIHRKYQEFLNKKQK